MTNHRSALRRLALTTMLVTLPLQTAFAQDATAVAERLKVLAAKQGIEIGWANITGNASVMTLEGVTLKPASEKESLPLGNITLSNVTEENDTYSIDTITTQPFSKTQDGVTVDISAFVINGMDLPPETSTDPLASFMIFDSAELANISFKVGDKTAFSMEGLGYEVTKPEDGKPLEFTGAAEKFTSDLTLIEDPQSKAVIEALGYQTITGFFEMAGSWQPTDGQLQLSQYDVSVENAGTLGVTFDFGGYTLDFIKSMQEMSKKMAEAPKDADNSAAGMAMLGLMQQLSVNGATIRFDDDSLTGKVLDYVGKTQGQSAKDVANMAKAMVPFGMAQLNNPDLTAQVTTAVNAFLDDPQNLEIAAAPPAPVPVAVIMAAGMSNPLDLPKTLGIKVTANQE